MQYTNRKKKKKPQQKNSGGKLHSNMYRHPTQDGKSSIKIAQASSAGFSLLKYLTLQIIMPAKSQKLASLKKVNIVLKDRITGAWVVPWDVFQRSNLPYFMHLHVTFM